MCGPRTGVKDRHYRFTVSWFHGQIVPNQIDSFYSQIVPLFQCKLYVRALFWLLGSNNEVYTLLFLLVT